MSDRFFLLTEQELALAHDALSRSADSHQLRQIVEEALTSNHAPSPIHLSTVQQATTTKALQDLLLATDYFQEVDTYLRCRKLVSELRS